MTDAQRDALQRQVGLDGQWLLDRLDQDDAAHLRDLRDVGTLRDVWAVYYERGADGHMRWNEGSGRIH